MGRVTERVLVAVMLLTVLHAASQQKGSGLSSLTSRQRALVQVKERANPVRDQALHQSPLRTPRKRESLTCTCTCNTSHVKSCEDWRRTDGRSGIRTVYVYGEPITVYCDQATDGGGWTVFQRRVDNSVDFYRGWEDYRKGFGDPEGNFWLGLDKLHRLTTSQSYELRVDLEKWDGTRGHATYSGFYVDGASNYFTLHFDSFTGGNAGNSLYIHRGRPFTTKDRDHDTNSGNCAQRYHGAWWYGNCYFSNLNGEYKANSSAPREDGINWYHFLGSPYYSMKFSEMKIRPQALDTRELAYVC